jgi:hypothetical protein
LALAPVAIRARCDGHTLARPLAGRVDSEAVQQVAEETDRQRVRGGALGGLLFGWLLFGGGTIGLPGAALGYGAGGGGGVVSSLAARRIDARLPIGALIKVQLSAPLSLSALGCPIERLPRVSSAAAARR